MSGAFVALFLATRKTNGSPSADQGLLQPGTTAAMLCYLKGDSHAPLPIPIFFASGKPIFEMVAPTDNMWQKSDFQVISH